MNHQPKRASPTEMRVPRRLHALGATTLNCPCCGDCRARLTRVSISKDSVRRNYACACGEGFVTHETLSIPSETERRHAARLAEQCERMAAAMVKMLTASTKEPRHRHRARRAA